MAIVKWHLTIVQWPSGIGHRQQKMQMPTAMVANATARAMVDAHDDAIANATPGDGATTVGFVVSINAWR